MRYTFRFLLANGHTAHYTFTASTYALARKACDAYANLAFAPGEVYDYEYAP